MNRDCAGKIWKCVRSMVCGGGGIYCCSDAVLCCGTKGSGTVEAKMTRALIALQINIAMHEMQMIDR